MEPLHAPRKSLVGPALFGLAAMLLAYYFWPWRPSAPSVEIETIAPMPAPTGASASASKLLPGAVSNVGGIPLDANGYRVLSPAGLPITDDPLPVARPIPIRAPAGTIIGYIKDAQGNSHPIRAGELKQIPNSPGSFVVVDMWADGGPAVVPATRGTRLSEQELEKLRAQEAAQQHASERLP